MKRLWLLGLLTVLTMSVSAAQDLPRMMSISADAVNVRSGPGLNFPIQWIYRQNALPIKVVAEYKNWRKFIDWQGDEGWVFKQLTNEQKSFLVTVDETLLYFDADEESQPVARLAKNKSGQVTQCTEGFCRVKLLDRSRNVYFGWVRESDIWGGCTKDDVGATCYRQ